jgi:hypothetical protein
MLTFALSINYSKARVARNIPAPTLTNTELQASPGTLINIHGNGFIKNLPSAHLIYFSSSDKNKSFKAKILSASSNLLTLETPMDIGFGDFRGKIKLRTRYLRSENSAQEINLALRPPAPELPRLIFNVVSSSNQIPRLFSNLIFNDKKLEIQETQALKPGVNSVTLSYSTNGFTSLASQPINFYYLPQELTKSPLLINGAQPLSVFAQVLPDQKIDISAIIKNQQENALTNHYFLTTPDEPQYLLSTITLKPIFISMVKATTPEYVIIKNRDDKNYNLTDCSLADDLKARYFFTKDFILNTGAEFKIEGTLSLNDDGDSVTITCPKLEIEKFTYKNLDSLGFGIKSNP